MVSNIPLPRKSGPCLGTSRTCERVTIFIASTGLPCYHIFRHPESLDSAWRFLVYAHKGPIVPLDLRPEEGDAQEFGRVTVTRAGVVILSLLKLCIHNWTFLLKLRKLS